MTQILTVEGDELGRFPNFRTAKKIVRLHPVTKLVKQRHRKRIGSLRKGVNRKLTKRLLKETERALKALERYLHWLEKNESKLLNGAVDYTQPTDQDLLMGEELFGIAEECELLGQEFTCGECLGDDSGLLGWSFKSLARKAKKLAKKSYRAAKKYNPIKLKDISKSVPGGAAAYSVYTGVRDIRRRKRKSRKRRRKEKPMRARRRTRWGRKTPIVRPPRIRWRPPVKKDSNMTPILIGGGVLVGVLLLTRKK